jgi:hypothetical protein
MDVIEAAGKPARPRLNPYTKAERRERVFARLRRLGWSYESVALEEGVGERRIRQIVADVLRREQLDDPTDHALLQLVRLERAHALAAEAVAAGDLRAIGALLKVLDSIDRYRKAGARKAVYDAAARKRLFAKLNRLAAQFEALAHLLPRQLRLPASARILLKLTLRRGRNRLNCNINSNGFCSDAGLESLPGDFAFLPPRL